MTINSGGSAFPQHDLSVYGMGPSVIDGGDQYDVSGMTLRDYFAGQALPAVIAATSAGQHHPVKHGEQLTLHQAMARDAYIVADAMLKARSTPTESLP